MKKRIKNDALAPHDPRVGSRVCLGCLEPLTWNRNGITYRRGLKALPHTYVESVCKLRASGQSRMTDDDLREREARETGRTERIPF